MAGRSEPAAQVDYPASGVNGRSSRRCGANSPSRDVVWPTPGSTPRLSR